MTELLLFLGNIGATEFLIILLIVLLLFGAKKIPELARGMGKGIREFKDASKEITKEVEDAQKDVKNELKEDSKHISK